MAYCLWSTRNDQDHLNGCRAVARRLRHRPQTPGLQSPARLCADERHHAAARIPVRSAKAARIIQLLRDTGAFSFLDGGFSKTGYSLLVDQSGGKGAGVLPAVLGALTLLTVPVPYTYERQLHGSVFKDGQLLKTYAYKRGGWTATTWYIPMTEPRSESEMLGDLMRDLDRDRLIPYQ